jgi:NADH-quinone oxidoreductase subunit J
MTAASVGFWVAAVVSVASAVMVVAHRSPVRSALFLIVNFCSLAFMYLLLNAQVLAALQVLVYAGAIMVLFLFVIMLLNLGGEKSVDDPLPGQKGAAVILGVFLICGLGAAVRWLAEQPDAGPRPLAAAGNQVQDIGILLMRDYVYPFELTSVLLLVGIIGAVVLAKRRPEQAKVQAEEGESGSA